ncbi:MAG: hypothetical protein Ct9H300mP2_2390 [Candidatus Neomarinimicrobiota bacterium]|nr:MAG: hypothetical protein Ct9H300mP2_2390 [Candidatus Neomarinimicrobiota bacterium]
MIPIIGGVSLSLALGFSFISFMILFLFFRTGDYRFYLLDGALSRGVMFIHYSYLCTMNELSRVILILTMLLIIPAFKLL